MNKKIYVGIAVTICILFILILIIVNYFCSREDRIKYAAADKEYTNEEKLHDSELVVEENNINHDNEIVQNQTKENLSNIKSNSQNNVINDTNSKVDTKNNIIKNAVAKESSGNKNTDNSNNTIKKVTENSKVNEIKNTSDGTGKNTHNMQNESENKVEVKEEGNSKLANTHFTKYNKEKTEEAVAYINKKMQQDELYSALGGKAIVSADKPTNFGFSYSGKHKLDGVCMAGTTVKVHIVDDYVYDSRGVNYYFAESKAYIYQET